MIQREKYVEIFLLLFVNRKAMVINMPSNIPNYYDLDNAGKIFPWTTNKRDTKVFRFACELYEEINPKDLQAALDLTIEDFPIFRSSLRQGLFWYYLRPINTIPVIHEENEAPCSSIYDANRYNLLFEVTYFKKRINVEVYHALTDGTGALQFLRTLVYHYICIHYAADFPDGAPSFDYDASLTQKAEDSFRKYYKKTKHIPIKEVRAYKIKGSKTPTGQLKVIEGTMSAQSILQAAHKYNATVSVFLTSLFLLSIAQNAPLSKKKRPIVITVPINLRNFFQSQSARNFFCTMNISYDFQHEPDDLPSIAASVARQFKEKLTTEYIASRMNGFSAMERNAVIRVVPLFLKNIIMRIAGKMNDIQTTASMSNIGRVKMPEGFEKYIRIFDVFISTTRVQMCMCSYGDNMTLSFSSALRDTDIQKDFFRMLSDMNIEIFITSNDA